MKRLKELDVLRGIAICFMVVGHTWFFKDAAGVIERLIYAFHMPLFFIISGFFYKTPSSNSEMKNIVIKKVKSLLVPYFMFGIIYLILDQLIWKELSLSESVRNLLLFPTGFGENKVTQTTILPGGNSLWFLIALFVMNLLYMMLELVIKNGYFRFIIITIMAIVTFVIFPENNYFELPFALRIVLECMPYFFLGIIFKKYYYKIKDLMINHKVATLCVWLVCLIAYVYITKINPTNDGFLNLNIYRNHWGNIPLSFINSLIGFYVFWIISVVVANRTKFMSNFLTFCGTNTIVFVCINHVVIKYVKYAVEGVSGEITSYYQMITVCILSISICAFIALIMMKTKLKVIFGK